MSALFTQAADDHLVFYGAEIFYSVEKMIARQALRKTARAADYMMMLFFSRIIKTFFITRLLKNQADFLQNRQNPINRHFVYLGF